MVFDKIDCGDPSDIFFERWVTLLSFAGISFLIFFTSGNKKYHLSLKWIDSCIISGTSILIRPVPDCLCGGPLLSGGHLNALFALIQDYFLDCPTGIWMRTGRSLPGEMAAQFEMHPLEYFTTFHLYAIHYLFHWHLPIDR